MEEIAPSTRRRVLAVLVAAAAVDVTYVVLWLFARTVVASETRPAYVEFENAFPLADTWLLVCVVGSAVGLAQRRPSALLWLLAGAGSGLYLLGIDSLYDVENGIWWLRGGAGLIELLINVLTLAFSLGLMRWAWRHRTALLAGA